MVKKIIIFSVIIIIIGLIAIVKIYNKPHVNIEESAPEISLDSEFLKNEFEQDESAANSKYLDKIIQIKGTIAKISEENNNIIISLGKEDLFGNVNCHMLENTENLNNLKPGQNITVKGICTGYLLDVILVRCVLIN